MIGTWHFNYWTAYHVTDKSGHPTKRFTVNRSG